MNKKTLLIIGGIAGALFLCICLVVAGVFAYRTISSTAEEVTSLVPTAVMEEFIIATEDTEPIPVIEPTDEPSVPEVQDDSEVPSLEDARYVAGYFVLALSDNDYAGAAEMTHTSMRTPDIEDQLKDLVEGQSFQPVIWEWTDSSINDGRADLTGVINFADDRRGIVEAQLTPEGDEWLVNYIHFTTEGESVDPGPLAGWDDQRTDEELTFASATADYFIINWINDDYDGAFLLCAQPMKDDVGGPEKIDEILSGLGAVPADWTWDSHDFIEVDANQQPVIELVGTLQYEDGRTGPITIQLMWEDGFWSVLYFDIKVN